MHDVPLLSFFYGIGAGILFLDVYFYVFSLIWFIIINLSLTDLVQYLTIRRHQLLIKINSIRDICSKKCIRDISELTHATLYSFSTQNQSSVKVIHFA
jgi:hypothetical protein